MIDARHTVTLLAFSILAVAACSPPASSATAAKSETVVPSASATGTKVATATAAPEPSLTPKPAPLQLEVVEWSSHTDVPGYPIVEALVRNPNDFPVRVNYDSQTEASLVNLSGEVLAMSSDVNWYVWSDTEDFAGGFILADELVPVSITFYPAETGEEIPEWESIKLATDLEEVVPVPFTREVEASLGEFRSTLEFDDGATLTLTNVSGQPLKAILFRATARDMDGPYVGLAGGALSVVSFRDDAGNPSTLEPGAFIEVIFLPDWSREVPLALEYEITAIGLLADE